MAGAVSHSEAKSICDKLECSPSQHQGGSNYGGKGKLIHHSGSNAGGSTGDFNPSGVPGYGSKSAKKAKKA